MDKRVETGAHPPQDALRDYDHRVRDLAILKREANLDPDMVAAHEFYVLHPEFWIYPLANSGETGDSDKALLRVHAAMKAFARASGSTPSPDPPPKCSTCGIAMVPDGRDSFICGNNRCMSPYLKPTAKAEVERLREALRQIADGEFATRGFGSVQSLARAALAPSLPTKEKK